MNPTKHLALLSLSGLLWMGVPSHAAPAADVSESYAFPVPFRPSAGPPFITFSNLSAQATIRIYTLDGALVRTLHENDADGFLRWDVRNGDGEAVASGVYLYVIENAEQIKKGKLLVVR